MSHLLRNHSVSHGVVEDALVDLFTILLGVGDMGLHHQRLEELFDCVGTALELLYFRGNVMRELGYSRVEAVPGN